MGILLISIRKIGGTGYLLISHQMGKQPSQSKVVL